MQADMRAVTYPFERLTSAARAPGDWASAAGGDGGAAGCHDADHAGHAASDLANEAETPTCSATQRRREDPLR